MSEPGAKAARAPRPPGTLRLAMRWFASAAAFGVLCAGLFALCLSPIVAVALWLAPRLADSPGLRGAIATLVLGLGQATLCALALGMLALILEVATPVALAAGAFAALLPALVLLSAQGPAALLPAQVLCARLLNLLLCAAAAGLAARRARSWRARRARPGR